jgi:hypothetical protein
LKKKILLLLFFLYFAVSVNANALTDCNGDSFCGGRLFTYSRVADLVTNLSSSEGTQDVKVNCTITRWDDWSGGKK